MEVLKLPAGEAKIRDNRRVFLQDFRLVGVFHFYWQGGWWRIASNGMPTRCVSANNPSNRLIRGSPAHYTDGTGSHCPAKALKINPTGAP